MFKTKMAVQLRAIEYKPEFFNFIQGVPKKVFTVI